jgi:hypothetical protein
MMGRLGHDQEQFFYSFRASMRRCLRIIPFGRLLRFLI